MNPAGWTDNRSIHSAHKAEESVLVCVSNNYNTKTMYTNTFLFPFTPFDRTWISFLSSLPGNACLVYTHLFCTCHEMPTRCLYTVTPLRNKDPGAAHHQCIICLTLKPCSYNCMWICTYCIAAHLFVYWCCLCAVHVRYPLCLQLLNGTLHIHSHLIILHKQAGGGFAFL